MHPSAAAHQAAHYVLYLVTDAGLSRGRSHCSVVEAAIRGGVTIVQYREKNASTRRMIEEAAELLRLCRAAGIPFIVNDRLDVALAVDADGAHVGQDDMPASLARRLLGRPAQSRSHCLVSTVTARCESTC